MAAKDEYSVVEMRAPWGILSATAFVYSLPVRLWARHLPWHPSQFWDRPGYVLISTLGLSVVGMLLALLGLWGRRQSRLCRWALFLNACVSGILLLAAVGLILWWRVLR